MHTQNSSLSLSFYIAKEILQWEIQGISTFYL